MITITIKGIPPVATMLAEVKAELFERIGFACDWMPEKAEEQNWPSKIEVWVETYQVPETYTPDDDTQVGFHELHNLYFPANGHGFYSPTLNGVWYRVCASWDDESVSTITRTYNGELHHWM